MHIKPVVRLTSFIKWAIPILCAWIWLMPSCTYDKGEIVLPSDVYCDSIQSVDTTIVSYRCDVQPILDAYCTLACHTSASAQGTPYLDNYVLVTKVADDGRLMCSINWESGCENMPDLSGTKIDLVYRETIQEWINQGKHQ